MIRYAIKLPLALLFTTLIGCTSGLTPKKTIRINIKASEQLNPYSGVEQHPLFIQVVQLKNIDHFQSLDFKSLYNEPAKALGEDLIYLEQTFPIKPGDTVTKTIKPEPDTDFIGLLYFFSNFEKATTRHWLPVQPRKKQCFNILLNNTKGLIERCK
ncbi:type VI secretion system lipoprotein TssJ [Endozoicomonas atrinae]|uniref:type VI secretion system lipoprotein TssJ n=1 Tax=Endozoicomonas atrinae TaxID=1333660 RepID=UPI0008243E30|nr:type VI secretion system lipoprotein TssJ [Endozoicomonas atrinae]